MLHQNEVKLLYFVALLIPFTISNTSSSKCTIDHRQGFCIFKGVVTTETEPHFYPTSDEKLNITKIQFKNSFMPILTFEICEAFPMLKKLDIIQLGIQTLMPTALNGCHELTYISFWENRIHEVPVELFRSNLKLQFISFQNNSLSNFEPRIVSHLMNLKKLALLENYITDLRIKEYPFLQSLQGIYVGNNELRDIDAHEITRKFPNLQEIYMEGNPINCCRLITIFAIFKRTHIAVKTREAWIRPRNYTPSIINRIECFLEENPSNYSGTIIKLIVKKETLLTYLNIFIAVAVLLILILGLVSLICVIKTHRSQHSIINVIKNSHIGYDDVNTKIVENGHISD